MSESAVPASQAPLTRRQIREAERAAALAAEREREAVLAAERERAAAEQARQTVVATDVTGAPARHDAVPQRRQRRPAPATTHAVGRGAADTEVLPVPQTPPSRRALRPAPRTAAVVGRTHRSWAPRAAVLGAMGALTIVAPLTGFAAPEAEPAAAVAVAPQPSVLDVLDSQAANVALAAVPASLLKDPAASSRATVLQTSRAADRDALTCAPLDGASGARAAVTERTAQYVRPLADGTYRNSSHYGNRSHPLSGAYSFHTGTDYAAPLGTPIYAVADGTVEYVGAGKDGRSSMLVILRHEVDGQTVYSWYVHMYRDGIHVTEGQQVAAGEVIAEVGNNGNSTGPHLHFEIHLDDRGTTTDPLPWLEKLGAVEVAALC